MSNNQIFTFREEDFTYWLDSVRLPSVTEIIKPLYDFSRIPPNVLENAGNYGKAVHLMIKLWLAEELDTQSLDPALIKPLEGFINWFKKQTEAGQLEYAEKPLYNKKLGYAGTPDLVFSEAIVDIKTRPYNAATDPLQLAGYAGLVAGTCLKRYVLFIDLDGNVKLTNAYKKQAGAIFRKLLDKWKMDKAVTDLIKNLKGEK